MPVVNKDGSKRVTTLFELYEQHGCLRSVEEEALVLGLRSKRHVYATGREAGGKPFSRGQIYHILRSPIYLGMIRHKDKIMFCAYSYDRRWAGGMGVL